MIEIDREKLAGAVRLARGNQQQGEIGALTGLSASSICRIERGRGLPSAKGLLGLMLWLDRDLREFKLGA